MEASADARGGGEVICARLCNKCGRSIALDTEQLPEGWTLVKAEWWLDEANQISPVVLTLCPTCRREVFTKQPPIKIRSRSVVVENVSNPIRVFDVVAETPRAEWKESFATLAEYLAFVRGVRCAASLAGNFDVETIDE